jgi:hypothetical protein
VSSAECSKFRIGSIGRGTITPCDSEISLTRKGSPNANYTDERKIRFEDEIEIEPNIILSSCSNLVPQTRVHWKSNGDDLNMVSPISKLSI